MENKVSRMISRENGLYTGYNSPCSTKIVPKAKKQAHKSPFYGHLRAFCNYSNSIVAGGFPVQSYSTLLTPFTSFTIRVVTLPRTSQGSSALSAVIKSLVLTARRT